MENNGNSDRSYLWGSKITEDGDSSHDIKRCLLLGRKAMTNLDSILKSTEITLLTKVHIVKWQLDHKEGWAPKNSCFQTVVLEKTLESPFDCKEIKPVNPKGSQPWIFITRTDAKAEMPVLWPLLQRADSLEKTLKNWRQEEKGVTEDEMVGWHHWLDGHEFEKSLGVGDGQGSLAFCSPWGCKVGHNWVSTHARGSEINRH